MANNTKALPEPKDLSHLFSEVTKNRKPSSIKEYYKFFLIPNIGNLAGGKKLTSPVSHSSCL